MLQQIRRKVVLGIGVAVIGILAVACAGAPRVGASAGGFQASVGGFSFQTPPLSIPFVSPAAIPANAQTQTTTQSTLQGVTHSGEGCPIALPQ